MSEIPRLDIYNHYNNNALRVKVQKRLEFVFIYNEQDNCIAFLPFSAKRD